jgi:hypothetical protein
MPLYIPQNALIAAGTASTTTNITLLGGATQTLTVPLSFGTASALQFPDVNYQAVASANLSATLLASITYSITQKNLNSVVITFRNNSLVSLTATIIFDVVAFAML